MRALPVLALCLAVCGCRSALPYPTEVELQRHVRSTVREPAFTLFSPYDPETTEAHVGVVRSEIALVRTLFGDQDATPVRIYLDPVEDQAAGDLPFLQQPSHAGLLGAASEGEYAFVCVPASIPAASALMHAAMLPGNLRHELAHLYAYRAGLSGATWFNEGLAMEVESMQGSASGLCADPFPRYLLAARKFAKPGSLATLITWSHGDDLSAAETSLRYVWAHALFRFFLEQEHGDGFRARARPIRNRSDAEILAQEAAWLAWLGSLDALDRIRAAAHSAAERERAVAVGVMANLAEQHAPELFTRAADDLALEMLTDPACTGQAATFLLFFRAAELGVEDIAGLARSAEPRLVLTVQALHARRNEPVDLAQARTAWESLTQSERMQLRILAVSIPGLSGLESASPRR